MVLCGGGRIQHERCCEIELNGYRHPGTSSANVLSEIIRKPRMESQHKWFFLVQLSRQLSLLLKRIANVFLSEHVLFGCGCTYCKRIVW